MSDSIYQQLILQLITEVPEYKPIYDHEMEYYGDISAWMLFGVKLVKFTLAAFRQSKTEDDGGMAKALTLRILDFVERAAMSSDDKITELIQTSFIEAIYLAGQDYDDFVSLLGDTSKRMLSAVEAWWNKPV